LPGWAINIQNSKHPPHLTVPPNSQKSRRANTSPNWPKSTNSTSHRKTQKRQTKPHWGPSSPTRRNTSDSWRTAPFHFLSPPVSSSNNSSNTVSRRTNSDCWTGRNTRSPRKWICRSHATRKYLAPFRLVSRLVSRWKGTLNPRLLCLSFFGIRFFISY